MELTDKLIIEKGLEELRKVDKFTIKNIVAVLNIT